MAGVEFLVFEGVSSDLRPWISALEDQFSHDDYSDLNKLALAVYLIGGRAEAFVHHRQESKYFYTWDDLKSSLILKFGERDDPERIRLEAERDKSVLNGRDTENTDAIQEVRDHIVNLEPNEMHQEESELNATKTNVDQEMEVVCLIQDKLSLEETNSVLVTNGVHPREAIPESHTDLVKNVECFDVTWLFSSRNLLDSVMVRDEFSKSLSDIEIIRNAHQMYDQKSLRATSSKKHRKQLKCWKFKFKRKNLTGIRPNIDQHKLVISVTSLRQNEKRFSDLADRLQKRNTVSDKCSGVQNIREVVMWFKYKQKYSMRKLSLMMKCSKKKERFAVILRLKQMREELIFALQEAKRRYDIARSASVRYGAIQDVESTFSQLERTYYEKMMQAENVGTKVLNRWTVIPVTRLFQTEKERLIGLAGMFQKMAVVHWFWILQELDTDSRTSIRWLKSQFLALAVTEREQQVLYTTHNKHWDPGGTVLMIILRVLWHHREHWYRPRLQIEDSFAIEMERYIENKSDCVGGTSNSDSHKACSVVMSKENCSAPMLILEKFKKIEHSLQEDLSSEEKRERQSWRFLDWTSYIRDILQNFWTEMWLIVTARWRCDQRFMTFHEVVQSSWFLGVFCALNGTDSFSIWHRWRYRPAIALCADQEEDKREHLNGNLPSGFEAVKLVVTDELIINMLTGARIKAESKALLNHGSVLFKKRKLPKSWQFKFRSMIQVQVSWLSFKVIKVTVFLSFVAGHMVEANGNEIESQFAVNNFSISVQFKHISAAVWLQWRIKTSQEGVEVLVLSCTYFMEYMLMPFRRDFL